MSQFIKKFLFPILGLIILALFMVGCSNNLDLTSSLYSTSNERAMADGEFEQLVSNNPIDEKYYKAMEQDSVKYEEIAVTYCNSWKQEFALTKDRINDFFDEDNSKELTEILTQWEEATMNGYRWLIEKVYENSKTKYGTRAFLEEYINLAEQYRDKTLWIKRIIYIKETDSKEDNTQGSQPSVVWYSQSQENNS